MSGASLTPTFFTHRPAFVLTLLLVTGILLSQFLNLPPGTLLLLLAPIIVAAALTLKIPYLNTAFLSIAILLTGVSLAQHRWQQYPANEIALFTMDQQRPAQLELRLLDDPLLIESALAKLHHLPPKQTVAAEVLRIKTWAGWQPASGQLMLQIDQANPELKIGQILRVAGMLERPIPAMNPGQFDWAAHYRQQRILTTLTIPHASGIQFLSQSRLGPLAWLRTKSRDLLAAGFTPDHAIDQSILRAMLLGDRDPKLRDIHEEFAHTGVAYQLNVTGLHIALLSWIVYSLCRLACLHPRRSLLITTAFVLLYAAVALPSYSGIRWIIFWLAFVIATLNRRTVDRFQLLSLAVFVMLLIHPLDIYSAGFQFSVAVALAITVFYNPLHQFLLSFRDPDKVISQKAITRTAAQERRRAISQWILATLQLVIIAWFAMLPLVAYQFGQLNIWSVPIGLLLLPFVLLGLIAGLLKILFTLLLPFAAHVWSLPTGWPVIVLRHGVDLFNKFPGGNVALAAPPLWLIIFCYALLLLPLLPPLRLFQGRRRWFLRAGPILALLAITFSPLFHRITSPNSLRITLLSLGAGQCAVIEPPNQSPILFDAGSSSISDLTGNIITPFLRFQSQTTIDQILLSHGDYDHISAAAELTTTYNVHRFLISPHFQRNAIGNIPDEMLLAELETLGKSPPQIAAGEHLDLGNGVAVQVLWPPQLCDFNSNNTGLVLRLTYAGKSVLFPADIQDPAFEALLKNPSPLKSDVLIAPHHGSSESLTAAFLKAVSPKLILASNSWRLTNKQKRFDKIEAPIPLHRTSQYGAITITITKDGQLSLDTFLHPRSPAP